MGFLSDFKYTFPCGYCEGCSKWQVYIDKEVDDIGLIEICVLAKCPIFGKGVDTICGED